MQFQSIILRAGLALLATSLAAADAGAQGPNPRHQWEFDGGARTATLGRPDTDDVVLTLKCTQIGSVETTVHGYAPMDAGTMDVGDEAWATFLHEDTEVPVSGKLHRNVVAGKFDLVIQHDLGSAMMTLLKGSGVAELDRDDRHRSRNGPQRISLKGARQAIDALISACSPSASGAASTRTPTSPVKRWADVPAQDEFVRYATAENYRGKVVLPDFGGRDRGFSMFRTRIGNGMKGGANFAGRLSIIEFGCGAGCLNVVAGDVSTGRIYDFPLGGEDYMSLTLKYRRDSRLVVAYWLDGMRCMSENVEWTGSGFRRHGQRDIGPEDACGPAMRE